MTSHAPPVVLVEGDDATLVADAVARLVAELVGDADRALAVEDHGGEEVDLAAVADGCATPPFLVERRIVVLREVGRFVAEELAPLLAYLEDPSPTTSLVLAAGGGQISTKLSGLVKAQGQVVSTKVDSKQSDRWLRERLSQAQIGLDDEAVTLVGRHLGEDIGRAVPLVHLLRAVYGEGARLSREDVEPYLGEAGSVTPWAFTDAIDSGDAELALTMLHRLIEGGDRHPLVVLAIVARHVQSLLRVDNPAIRTEAQAAEALGIAAGRSTYPAKKALMSAERWGSAGVAEAVGLVADAELALKGAGAWPPEAVLEVLVARLCRLARAHAGAGVRRG